ncbi:MAG TPA: DNA gyrase inhibitor YacG [Polyangiaceae bacterium]|nr:DNA gyrase inhibitor YacG [Polyangiaceae bacterium]
MRIVCPACKKVLEDVPVDYPPRPFCSPRCKFVDLDNWLSERYFVSQPVSTSQQPPALQHPAGQGAEEDNFN